MSRNEPITLAEAVRLLVVAVLTLVIAFDWWNPTEEQLAAVLGLYGAVSVVLSVIARQHSTPTAKVALTIAQADALRAIEPPLPPEPAPVEPPPVPVADPPPDPVFTTGRRRRPAAGRGNVGRGNTPPPPVPPAVPPEPPPAGPSTSG